MISFSLNWDRIYGLTPVIQLYTVPGQNYYQSSRKVVLKGADGIVFVADSARERAKDNLESWRDMQVHIRYHNLSENIPIVIQLNKQDTENAITQREIRRLLGAETSPLIGAIAVYGKGVLETVKLICKETILSIQPQDKPAVQNA